jgi:acyl-coenzyme A synthetase/AMP-(fatty) acid ligase
VPWLRAADVNVVHLVPSLSTRWVAAAPTAGSVPSLRWSLFAGEPLYGRHVGRWRSIAPASRVVNLYGPSETTLAKFWHTVAPDPGAGIVPVGRPLPGTTVGSGTTGGDPPVGEPFRIMIRTRDGSLGYLPNGNDRHDSLTRQDGVTTFVTNDRGRLDGDGLLVVEGRLDSVAKRNGILVDLADVAARALDDASVAQAYCVQVDEDTSGDLILAIEGTQAFSLPDLSRHLRTTLGSAMPNEIMVFESLPVLPSGKIDRLGVRAAVGTRRSLTAGREKV